MRRAQFLLAVLVVVSGLAGPARAESGSIADGDPPENTVLAHCVVTAVQVGVVSPASNAPARCFATFAEAIAEATNGAVMLPPDADTLEQEMLDVGYPPMPGGSLTATVIGIEYEHKYFGGWTYVIQSTNVRGCNGYNYRVPSLPSARNNEISSAKTYAGCKSSHFSGSNLTGARYLCGCAQMGSMNDQTSSIFFSATGYRT